MAENNEIVTIVTDAVWANAEHSAFDCKLGLNGNTPTDFTATSYDPEEYGREIFNRGKAGDFGAIKAFIPPSSEAARENMPRLTARQLRLGLLHLGKLAGVPVAISALPSPDKEQAEIEWQFASEFRRTHPLIVQLIPILGLTDEQVDPVWEQFSTV